MKTNKEKREFANQVAKKVARILGLKQVPRCHRITRRRGRGGVRNQFSIPGWAFEGHEAFSIYYIAHEVAHFVSLAHDSRFHAAEQAALQPFGFRIVYEKDGAGPYAAAIKDESGKVLCDEFGRVLDNPATSATLTPA